MRSEFRLESFDTVEQFYDAPSGDYQQGYDAGYAEACAAANLDQSRLQGELVQSIADLEFTYGEVHADVTRSLAPLFDTIMQVILPFCVSTGLTTHIAAVLQNAAAGQLSSPLQLTVHPTQRNTIAAAFENTFPDMCVTSDETLGPHAAWIRVDERETLIDLDQTMAQIIVILGAIDPQTTRLKTNG